MGISGYKEKKSTAAFTNEILTEYYEVCGSRYPKMLIEELVDAMLYFSNIILVTPFFRWNIIYNDPDDNKVVDCAVAGNADYIITNDTDFDVLKRVQFPKITVLTPQQFEMLFKERLTNDT